MTIDNEQLSIIVSLRNIFELLGNFPEESTQIVNCQLSIDYLARSSQNATALAAATFRESTPWYMGIFTV